MLSDIQISQQTKLSDIREIAKKLDIAEEDLELYGKYKAKIGKDFSQKVEKNKNGKLILVTACNPIPAGEGKTTTTIGLGDALSKLQKKTLICLREPSLGPVFGVKGGAAGGGYAQVAPMEDINLHFTGDFHAITSAHLLLSAAIDNHIYFGNELHIDTKNILWKRAFDVNDRALRNFSYSPNGKNEQEKMIDSGAMITTASEIMAIFCLASDIFDLKTRIGNIVFATDTDGNMLKVKDLGVEGSMTALLKDAIQPNIVQTLEHTPCLVHGGPFANIAHGCNSLIATKLALKTADYTVTEAGFGSDLGAQKFFDIKCHIGNIQPDTVVLVATVKSIKYHGGVSVSELTQENISAMEQGITNLEQHIENLQKYNLPLVVCLNRFHTDTEAEIAFVRKFCTEKGVDFELGEGFVKGGEGMKNLASKVVEKIEKHTENNFTFLCEQRSSITEKIEKIVREIYRGKGVKYLENSLEEIKNLETNGLGNLPVCIAKTPVSFSDNPKLLGAPRDFEVSVKKVRVSAGAGFIVVETGAVMVMPGLSRKPNALKIDIGGEGEVVGLD